ncbi:MGH1-like glycoside hydrolase domain-containing protein [Candidatus Epulonipiscium viviparus]|uniref:MGH1-like glycoside hydrolase domain-containing protein n=1 Tax=Candidatus Epulonipiscium viviparus TaxID=420336 RepID=UPI0027380F93|nr:trehalase family glycosidase [Candidatus Epulopiscium viviparus]
MESLLPVWGPYSKKYMGVSNVLTDTRGIRFDTVVHPTIVNSGIPVPNVTFPCGYHPWEATEDLSYYSYRYDLVWKDEVFADVSFSKLDKETILIRTEFVNNSKLPVNCMLNYFHAIEYPFKNFCELNISDSSYFVHSLDYEYFEQATKRPWDNLQPDGKRKGEFLDQRFVGYRGLGDRVARQTLPFKKFGEEVGDMVGYAVETKNDIDEAYVVFGYRTVSSAEAIFELKVAEAFSKTITFPATAELGTVAINVGAIAKGHIAIDLSAEAAGGIEFNFLVLTAEPETVMLSKGSYNFKPNTVVDDGGQFRYMYPGINTLFYFQAFSKNVRHRTLDTGCLEDATISRLSNSDYSFDNVLVTFTGSFNRKRSDPGFYENALVHSIFIPENKSHIEYAIISNKKILTLSTSDLEKAYLQVRGNYQELNYKKEGARYALSNEILKATLLTNIVYPIYKNGRYIKHFSPGKRWDSLYTWDSGFIGLGLLEFNPKLAEYVLDMYLSNVPDYAFLMHGSPVPVQIYLLLELIQRTQNFDGYTKYYSDAKRFYEFLAGKAEGSTTNKFKSGLLSTFDYFYNASGMDDLPAQVFTHQHKLSERMAAVVSTSQVIRSAKILKMIAIKMHLDDDVAAYDEDIANFTQALQKYSWDAKTGYFSYVYHDKEGKPLGFLQTEANENLNKSVDGIYPIIAGACTPSQQDIILKRLKSPKHLLSPVGISSVDLSATYFNPNGYWNGGVWFPHQWFIFKTMLDIGDIDFALQIATCALEAWKREVDDSYYTFEELNIATGRGGWFHHFAGLSTPINIWANAYYKPGTVTAGFETWIDKAEFNSDFSKCTIAVTKVNPTTNSSLIICMAEDIKRASVKCSIKKIAFIQRIRGTFEFTIPKGTTKLMIQID